MDYERCEEERRGCINLAEHRCVSFTERYSVKYLIPFLGTLHAVLRL